jgi:hypothetical protein
MIVILSPRLHAQSQLACCRDRRIDYAACYQGLLTKWTIGPPTNFPGSRVAKGLQGELDQVTGLLASVRKSPVKEKTIGAARAFKPTPKTAIAASTKTLIS